MFLWFLNVINVIFVMGCKCSDVEIQDRPAFQCHRADYDALMERADSLFRTMWVSGCCKKIKWFFEESTSTPPAGRMRVIFDRLIPYSQYSKIAALSRDLDGQVYQNLWNACVRYEAALSDETSNAADNVMECFRKLCEVHKILDPFLIRNQSVGRALHSEIILLSEEDNPFLVLACIPSALNGEAGVLSLESVLCARSIYQIPLSKKKEFLCFFERFITQADYQNHLFLDQINCFGSYFYEIQDFCMFLRGYIPEQASWYLRELFKQVFAGFVTVLEDSLRPMQEPTVQASHDIVEIARSLEGAISLFQEGSYIGVKNRCLGRCGEHGPSAYDVLFLHRRLLSWVEIDGYAGENFREVLVNFLYNHEVPENPKYNELNLYRFGVLPFCLCDYLIKHFHSLLPFYSPLSDIADMVPHVLSQKNLLGVEYCWFGAHVNQFSLYPMLVFQNGGVEVVDCLRPGRALVGRIEAGDMGV